MLPLRRALLVAALATAISVLFAGAASAATTVGQLFAPTSTCSAGTVIQKSVASGNTYIVPAAGVITSWQFQDGTSTLPGLKLKVGRTADSGTTWSITAESAAGTQTASSVSGPYPVRIPVKAGDAIGVYEGGGKCGSAVSLSDAYAYTLGTDVAPGSALATAATGIRFPVAATVEADADGDGYGDETQDKCPTAPGSLQGCPKADLSLTKTASAANALVGQNVTYTLTATNNGPDAAPGVVVSDALPAGEGLVSATPSTGGCTGAVSCNVGTLASGASATVTVVANMASAGAKTDTGSVDSAALDQAARNVSGAGDTNSANNSVSVTTNVAAPTPPPPFIPPSFHGASLKGGSLTVTNGAVVVRVTSPLAANGKLLLTDVINPATGTVISAKKPRRKTITLGSVTFSIVANQTKHVTIRLTSRALALLKQNKNVKATVTAITTDLFGTTSTTKTTVTLKPAKHKKH